MQEERLVKIKELIDRQCLMDDIFFSCLMDENIALAEIILQIILDKPDLKVERVATQRTESDLVYRGVRFDVFAVDSKGQQYNIEVQVADFLKQGWPSMLVFFTKLPLQKEIRTLT